ncbi:ATP-dependent DNA ligase Cdc17 [Friedmanniomyces endolithicus]|uniref:DNA ligase n=1 Tax=Friedmanniomyces endolithicus TaxID=329885 RepID=A0AAN6H8E1_9PEZI|nr:ATP-dependent DNA ligase Cdc17 [Friedmanniomyces endolithicus]KAK0960001.1 ATP-dependent DNA ligase Cdc17 [Friedmanniomyces endolithicus]KAK0960879.1 ATP-dependent DNA ligase Cdc17 [Friedmanniomyces endolithicus]KAK1038574.1 ATP-dependent DNA ligase Cdc17 [Friedmanniomyces endolithicus]
MAPKQATLGKFFGGENGGKAAPQQSRLKFGSKAGQQAKAEDEAEAGGVRANGVNGHVKDEDVDVKMEDVATVKGADVEDAKSSVKVERPSPSPAKKRSVSDAADEDVEDADEAEAPPTKKRRQKATEPKPKKGVATKKSASKSKPVVEDDMEVDEPPPTSKPADLSNKNHEVAESDEDVKPLHPKKSSVTTKSPPAKSKPAAKAPIEAVDEDDATETETESVAGAEAVDSLEEVEEDKPAVSAKSRKKLQSTLTSPVKDVHPDWAPGEPVPYAALCVTFSRIEMTTKRLEISAMCSAFLQHVLRLTPDDLLPTVLLMTGKLAADYSGIELGIGESLIMKAIGETTGRSLKIIKEDQQKIGDLGLVAAKSRQNQPTMFKPKPLTVRGVHDGLMKIAVVEGQGAQGRKVDGIKKLLSSADVGLAKGQTIDINQDKGGPSESKFIIRALEGKMRLGLADKTLQVALAHAMVAHAVAEDGKKVPSEPELKKGEEVFKTVYSELPAYEVIVPALLKGGIWKLRETCKLQPGVPLKPMLAKPTKSISEVLDRFEGKDFTCEYKYDGERAQIHFVSHSAGLEFATTVAPKEGKSEAGISNIFSRNSEDLSKKYPDILAKLPTWIKSDTQSFVLDCETVAWDVEKKHVLPFQQLMTRKKKDVKAEDVKVKVCVFAFDLLYLNGEAIVAKSFRERRDLLYSAFTPVEGEFAFAQYGNTHEIDEIQVLLEDSIKASCEGLMVKMLDGVESHYEPSRRSQNWLKVKKDYLAGAGDSLDLVVLGAYYGKGKRTSVYGAFQLACWNPNTQNYETVCNIGTGFSEVLLAELHETLSPLVIDRAKPFYDHSTGKNDRPDVWFEPRFVWEVKTADLTLSPRYRAASAEFGSDGTHKGVSLRFPRFIRAREDKKPDDATNSQQVAEMYRRQAEQGKEKKAGIDDDFEY